MKINLKNLFYLAASGVLAAILAMSAALPAMAQETPTAPNSGAGASRSYNWSGYVAQSGAYTSVSATWIVPQPASQRSLAGDVAWVGIGGVSSSDLIQAGTMAIFDDAGRLSYKAWYELLPDAMRQIPLAISSGDSVTVSISQKQTGLWNIIFSNNTSNKNYSTTVEYQSSLSSAEWIEEMPSTATGFLPLDNFGSIKFSNGGATLNNNLTSIAGSGAQKMTMINANGEVLAEPSALGEDGASFTVTRTTAEAIPATSPQTYKGGRGQDRTIIDITKFIPMPDFRQSFGLSSQTSPLPFPPPQFHLSFTRKR